MTVTRVTVRGHFEGKTYPLGNAKEKLNKLNDKDTNLLRIDAWHSE